MATFFVEWAEGGGEGRLQTKAEAENLINCGTVTWLSEG